MGSSGPAQPWALFANGNLLGFDGARLPVNTKAGLPGASFLIPVPYLYVWGNAVSVKGPPGP